MRRSPVAPLILLLALSAAFALAPATRAEAQCAGQYGGTTVAGVGCVIDTSVTASGPVTVNDNLVVASNVTITISPIAAGLAFDVKGTFTMETGSQINGDYTGAGPGANVDIVATGDITLEGTALISLVQTGTSCSAASQPAGSIRLVSSGGNVTTEVGSVQRIVRPCGKGEIFFSGINLTLDGLALSEGTTSRGAGGPITAKASCDYTQNGSLISVGKDVGADLVHVEGGCAVKIFGLVQSTGPGHSSTADNRCMPPNRPDKKATDRACVEIWAGDSLVIDARPPLNGEIDADIATGGGAGGTAWIDIFARGNITIIGDTVAPFAVHANEYLSGGGNGQGNPVTIKSITGSVIASDLAVQSSDTVSGGKGGLIVVEAKLDVDLKGATLEAAGSTTGGSPAGGRVDVRAFNGGILADVASLIDVRGGPPLGVINLTACTPNPMVAFPPGSVSAGATVNKTEGLCGGTPLLPLEIVSGDGKSYVVLPLCVCAAAGCPCVTDFSFVAQPRSALINGAQLTAVTQVQLSTGDCNPGAAGTQVVPFLGAPTNAQIVVDLTGVLTGNYKIITISGGGSCCSAATLSVP